MIFFCFSSKDRDSIVEALLFHITNYALPVWYDRYEILMGDDRDHKNFVEGVGASDYAVIILSQNSISSVCAREEMELIYQKHQNGKMCVFPLFYNLKADKIPPEFSWMKKLVYKEITDDSSVLSASNHIICKFLSDILSKCRITTLDGFLSSFGELPAYAYLTALIRSYTAIDDKNRNAKITLLYAGCLFLRTYFSISTSPAYYFSGVERLFRETQLHLPIDLRETLILEKLFLLLINAAIFGNII